jgi:hypothetical protein
VLAFLLIPLFPRAPLGVERRRHQWSRRPPWR